MEGSVKEATRNKVMEIFERLNHLNEVASENLNSSRRIKDLLLGPEGEEAKKGEDQPEPCGILDRMIAGIHIVHHKLLKTRDENLATIREIKPGK